MQEKDTIEEHYRKAFSNFEPPPPEDSWSKIRARLHPEEEQRTGFFTLKRILGGLNHSRNLYPLLATAAMVLLLVMIWFSYSNKHFIRGHAYAGESRLCKGTAFLFRVYDKVKPFDTVTLIQSVPVDASGFYQFSGIDHGNYFLRINPAPGSEITRSFMPSFFDQDSASAEANLIRIEKEDPSVDIHLLPK